MTDPASLQALVIAANDERDWHICAHAEACRLGGEWRERAEAAEARVAQLEEALNTLRDECVTEEDQERASAIWPSWIERVVAEATHD